MPYTTHTGTAAPRQAPIDRLREAACTQLFWVILPERDGTWTLRHLDDTTGELSEPRYASARIGTDPANAIDWASRLTGIDAWRDMTSHTGGHIEQAYDIVREIGRQPRAGRTLVARITPAGQHPQLPDLMVLTLHERWTSTGKLSEPLAMYEYDFVNDEDMLRQVADWYGLDPQGWTTVVPGAEYEHY